MSGFKEKVQVFSSGLMLGLLIGGGFFILKLDQYFSKMKEKPGKETAEEISVQPLPEKQNQKKTKQVKAQAPVAGQKNDSLASSASENVAVLLITPDSLRSDSGKNGSANTIVVKKDELLSSRNLEMLILGPASAKKDSLLSQLSGIRDNNGKAIYKIEFWQSPINYKGYKMAKNKILLYGLGDNEAIKLYKFEDEIYLRYSSTVYRLDYTGDFRQMEKVTDESVLAQLK